MSNPRDQATNTEHDRSVHATTAPSSAQIVQVETLGRQAMIVILVMFVVIVLIGILSGYALGAANEQAESTDDKLRRMDSRVYVLEYDAKGLCGQLLAKQIVEACH